MYILFQDFTRVCPSNVGTHVPVDGALFLFLLLRALLHSNSSTNTPFSQQTLGKEKKLLTEIHC